MPHVTREVTSRFNEAVQVLLETGAALSEDDIAAHASLPNSELKQIREGIRKVSIEWISALVELYMVNPLYLFGGTGRPILGMKLRIDEVAQKRALSAARAKEPAQV